MFLLNTIKMVNFFDLGRGMSQYFQHGSVLLNLYSKDPWQNNRPQRHQARFANWGPPCRVLIENVSEWFSIFFLLYRPNCWVDVWLIDVDWGQ